METTWVPNDSPEASWMHGLLKGSWSGLGELLERSWGIWDRTQLVYIGFWPGQGRLGDWFQNYPRAKGAEKESRNVLKLASELTQNDTQMAAKWALAASWRSLGGFLEPFKRLGRRRGGFQRRMKRSWAPLGALRGPRNKVGIGSWPA